MVPSYAYSYAITPLLLAAVFIFAGLSHHKFVDGNPVYGYPPAYCWLGYCAICLGTAVCIVFPILPVKYGLNGPTWTIGLFFIMMGAIIVYVAKRLKIVLGPASMDVYDALRGHLVIPYSEIIRIKNYASIQRTGKITSREIPKGYCYTRDGKRFLISGMYTDYDDLIQELRKRCGSAQYIEKQ